MPVIELENIHKTFGDTKAVDDLSLRLEEGQFVTLLGPSGCGKTTTLRLISGFLKPDRGTVKFYGKDVTNLPSYKRSVGMVFQNYALFPHMTIYKNIAFGLRMRKVDKGKIDRRVNQMLDLTQLHGLGERYPSELSGGQQQRVALARALVIEPDLLLLDEPLSNLDAKLRKEMRIELLKIHNNLGITTLYVTHDQEEGLTLADRLIIMNEGLIVQEGSPKDIYEDPQNSFVADFIGTINRIEGKILESTRNGTATFLSDSALLLKVLCQRRKEEGSPVIVCIRPEKIRLAKARETVSSENSFLGRIEYLVYIGSVTNYYIRLENGEELRVDKQNIRSENLFNRGEEVNVILPKASFVILDKSEED